MAESGSNLYDSNMRVSTKQVQHYSLYGEFEHLPDVMHCETIAERSVLHEWELAPHRHDRLHQLLLLRLGGGVARLDDVEVAITPGTLVNVPIGTIHAFIFEPGTDGLVLTLADAILDELLARNPEVRRQLDRRWVGNADSRIDDLMSQIATEYADRWATRALVLRGLAGALLGHAARVGTQDEHELGDLAPSHLLRRFESMLELHFREHWRVVDYARALAVTPTHLSRVVRTVTGAPTSRMIDARLIREARRQLAFTNLSISSIAYTLGFVDPALFSRVFSRVTGSSPRTFRRQLEMR